MVDHIISWIDTKDVAASQGAHSILMKAVVFLFLLSSVNVVIATTQTLDPVQLMQQKMASFSYLAQPEKDGSYKATNPVNNWQINFLPSGKTVLQPLSSRETYQIGIVLRAVNRQQFSTPRWHGNDKNTFAYEWDDNVREWWTNSAEGIEQWFQINHPPEGRGLTTSTDLAAQLELQLELTTGLAVSQQDNRLKFTTPAGQNITYEKLKVWDATGRILPSQMRLSGRMVSLLVDDSNALYPVTIDPSFEGDAWIEHERGGIVAVSGNTMVVSWPDKDRDQFYDGSTVYPQEFNAGIVYLYTRPAIPQPVREWTLQQVFEPPLTVVPQHDRYFGVSLAIDGDVLLIGNRVYTRSSGIWVERAQLAPADGSVLGNRSRVAIDGGTIVIGAGYVFNRVGNTYNWSNQAQLIPSTTGGVAVEGVLAIQGNTIVIGDQNEDGDASSTMASPNANAADAGAAYVFTGSGNSWVQQAYLKAANAGAGDKFGGSVGISGDTIIVGARYEASSQVGVNPNPSQDDNFTYAAGAAYIFQRSGSTWSQQARLKASNTTHPPAEAGDEFGTSVAIDGHTVVVGAPNEDGFGRGRGDYDNGETDAGAAYVFSRTGNSWSQINYLKEGPVDGLPDGTGPYGAPTAWADPSQFERFGMNVSIDGEILVVNAAKRGYGSNIVIGRGATTIFIRRYTVSVDVTGLPAGETLTVNEYHASDNITVNANGLTTLPTRRKTQANYWLTVADTPADPNYTCTVYDETGVVGYTDVVVEVKCEIDMHTIAGNVTGLTSAGLVLQNHGGVQINVASGQNEFLFPPQQDGSDYLVSVANQPAGLWCTVNRGYGSISGSDVTDVAVFCHQNQYSVKGEITGLLTTLELINNSTGEIISLTDSDASFQFQNQAENSEYSFRVNLRPSDPSQTCIFNGSGYLSGTVQGDLFLNVECVVDYFHVRVQVYTPYDPGSGSMLPYTGLVLQNNGGDDLIYSPQDDTFPLQIDGSPYDVTIASQPADDLACFVSSVGSSTWSPNPGVISGRHVAVEVRCIEVHTVTPAVIGGGSIDPSTPQLVENQLTTAFTLMPDPGYVLDSVVGCWGDLNGNTYTTALVVTDCTVTATFVVTTESYRVHVQVTTPPDGSGGVIPFTGLVLQNNGGDDLVYSSTNNGFPLQLNGTPYNITVLTQPADLVCRAADGSGVISGQDVTVQIQCSRLYTVTPSVVGAGSISPDVAQSVEANATTSFTIMPEAGNAIADVTGCSGSLNGNTYTTAPVVADCVVTAKFMDGTSHCTSGNVSVGPVVYLDQDVVEIKAGGHLVTAGVVALNVGSTVSFTANDYIDLNSGFKVAADSEFTATVRPVDCATE